MNTNQVNMSFRDYYGKLKNQHVELRDKICEALGISVKTFYNKLNNESFDNPEKLVISSITEIALDELFPKDEQK